MKKKVKTIYLVTALAGILFFILMFVLTTNSQRKREQKINIVPQKISFPQDSIKASFPIENKITPNDFSFPKEVPTVSIKTKSITENDAYSIAERLDFVKNPIEFTDIKNGKLLIWNGDSYDMTIYLKIGKIKISPSYNPTEKIKTAQNKQITDQEKIQIAKDFLKRIGITEEELKYFTISYLKIEKNKEVFVETSKENAEVFQINFSPTIDSTPLVTPSPKSYLNYVQIIKDGTIVNSEINLIENVQKNNNFIKIKSYEEFKNKINDSVLISLDNGNINIPDIKKEDIIGMTIEKAELGYLIDKPTKTELYPVFILTGECEITNSKNKVKATLYLEAYSSSN